MIFLNIWKYRDIDNIPYIGASKHSFFTKNIINNITIDFDQVERVGKRDYKYYNKVQPLISNINSVVEGPMLYSFSLNLIPNRFQPSGKCNLCSYRCFLSDSSDFTTARGI